MWIISRVLKGPLHTPKAHLLKIQIRFMQIVRIITSIILPITLSASYVSYSKILKICLTKERVKTKLLISNSFCMYYSEIKVNFNTNVSQSIKQSIGILVPKKNISIISVTYFCFISFYNRVFHNPSTIQECQRCQLHFSSAIKIQ